VARAGTLRHFDHGHTYSDYDADQIGDTDESWRIADGPYR
jgi:hypothetical protein